MLDDPATPDDPQSEQDNDVTTIDLTSAGGASGPSPTGTPSPVAVPPAAAPPIANPTWNVSQPQPTQPTLQLTTYVAEKQQDYVRLTFTVGLLVMFGWVIVWASIESASWPTHWDQTKDMLQIILPALTGLIGSVSGFYFGSRGNTKPS